jgi:hypothetical protein
MLTERVTPVIDFSEERLTPELLDAAMPLLEAHYREIAHYQDIPLSIDREVYLAAAASGQVRVFLCREDGALQGYAVFFVRANPHYSTSRQAVQDVLWLHPSLRHQMLGARFIAFCDEQLRRSGVQCVYHHVKLAHDFGSTLRRLDYEPVETIWVRRLDK